MKLTKEGFLSAYRECLLAEYGDDWPSDQAKLDKFMESVRLTISSRATTWNHLSPLVTRAWRLNGMSGTPTLSALRLLPSDSNQEEEP